MSVGARRGSLPALPSFPCPVVTVTAASVPLWGLPRGSVLKPGGGGGPFLAGISRGVGGPVAAPVPSVGWEPGEGPSPAGIRGVPAPGRAAGWPRAPNELALGRAGPGGGSVRFYINATGLFCSV